LLSIYGNVERKYFAIVDKSFYTNGSLYYPNQALSPDFKSWVPEFFGNTITVNGKVWPQIPLSAKPYRFVFLNGCQSRYLNIYFLNNLQKLDFQIFRRDSDYLSKPVTVKEHLLLIGGRI
jgi:FtsP/CotA-like multicopper oxidase with cupredoxin domain